MIEKITRAAVNNRLTTVLCVDRITGEKVEVLCIESEGGMMRPVAKLYPDIRDANADVTTPEGYNGPRLQ